MSENAVLKWASGFFSEGCYAKTEAETELGYVFGIRRYVDADSKFYVEIDYTQFGGDNGVNIVHVDIDEIECIYREATGVVVYTLKPSSGSLSAADTSIQRKKQLRLAGPI